MFPDPVAPTDRELVAGLRARVRATLLGRRTFDVGLAHCEDVPWQGPAFVVTHETRPPLPRKSGTFVPKVAEAMESARGGDGAVMLMGAHLSGRPRRRVRSMRWCSPWFRSRFGAGTRLFDEVVARTLRPRSTIESPTVTHMPYDVVLGQPKAVKAPFTALSKTRLPTIGVLDSRGWGWRRGGAVWVQRAWGVASWPLEGGRDGVSGLRGSGRRGRALGCGLARRGVLGCRPPL